ncbi:MAG: hypothetical protein AB7O62_07850 [Pirellulales bacterium]
MSAAPLCSAEIYSNSVGGGTWSDPATWRGGAVPTAEDDVVIARDDTVVFDRDDSEGVTCQLLSLDPRSALTFKSGMGRVVLSAANVVESYGLIKLDASKSAKDQHELRLLAEEAEQRVLRFAKGGGLIVSGRGGLPKGRFNAVIMSPTPAFEQPPEGTLATLPSDPTALLEAMPGASLDLQRAELLNVNIEATGIDNTGARLGERLNVVRCGFRGTGRLKLTSCDSAVVRDNRFERQELPKLQPAALYISSCPLIEVRGNVIRGTYAGGLTCYGQNDCVMQDNVIEKCDSGVYWYGTGFMFKGMAIRDCPHGMTMTSARGAMEDVLIERCQTAYHHAGADMQCTNLVVRELIPTPNGYFIHYVSGPLRLLNCDIQPEQIVFSPSFTPEPVKEGKPRPPTVQSLSYLVAQVSGQVPPGVSVEVVTAQPAAALPPGAQDLNIRNSPAPLLKNGLTPLPKTLEPIIVRGWSFDPEAKPAAAPGYILNVLGPAGSAGGARQVLKSMPVTPQADWFRAEPNGNQPTIEVTLP